MGSEGTVNKSGLVRENGSVRPADFAGHLMAEAVDGAVELIVSLIEDRKQLGLEIDPGTAADVVRAVDDRLADADSRMPLAAPEPSAGSEAGHSARLEVLSALGSRAEALISSQERPVALDPEDI